METLQLGNSGLMVSRFVFGTLTFAGSKGFEPVGTTRGDEAKRQIDMVLAAGGNAIDTADLYSRGDAEEVVGEALAGRREHVLLFTKAGFPMGEDANAAGASRQHLTRALEASLRRLRTDYVDIYFVHRWDGLTPVEETVATMSDFVRSGKIRYWGVSNYSG